MYGEWMDSVPILVSDCYEYNIQQLKIAKRYYMEKNNIEMANYYQRQIEKEKQKLFRDINKPSKIKQIINIIFN